MYIKDAIYKPVRIKAPLPLAEGAVLTLGGNLASEDGSDAYGVVPQRVTVLPPSRKINIAVSGTIDLTENKNVTFSDNMIAGLHEFNFVPYQEASGGGGGESSLPDYTSDDLGKVLTVAEGTSVPTEVIIVPLQSVTVSVGAMLADVEIDATGANEYASDSTPASLFIDGVRYDGTFQQIRDGDMSYPGVVTDGGNVIWRGGIVAILCADGEHTVKLSAISSVPSVTASWQTASGGTPGYSYVKGTQYDDEEATTEAYDDAFRTPLYNMSGWYGVGDSFICVFDGIEYTGVCEDGTSIGDSSFQSYPFYVHAGSRDVYLYTETAGTFSIELWSTELSVTDDFENAVKSSIMPISFYADSDNILYKDYSLSERVTNEDLSNARDIAAFSSLSIMKGATKYNAIYIDVSDVIGVTFWYNNAPQFANFTTYIPN